MSLFFCKHDLEWFSSTQNKSSKKITCCKDLLFKVMKYTVEPIWTSLPTCSLCWPEEGVTQTLPASSDGFIGKSSINKVAPYLPSLSVVLDKLPNQAKRTYILEILLWYSCTTSKDRQGCRFKHLSPKTDLCFDDICKSGAVTRMPLLDSGSSTQPEKSCHKCVQFLHPHPKTISRFRIEETGNQ